MTNARSEKKKIEKVSHRERTDVCRKRSMETSERAKTWTRRREENMHHHEWTERVDPLSSKIEGKQKMPVQRTIENT